MINLNNYQNASQLLQTYFQIVNIVKFFTITLENLGIGITKISGGFLHAPHTGLHIFFLTYAMAFWLHYFKLMQICG